LRTSPGSSRSSAPSSWSRVSGWLGAATKPSARSGARCLRLFRRFVPATDTLHGRGFSRAAREVSGYAAAGGAAGRGQDIVFAVDSIPAVFAVTQEPFLVFTSNASAVPGQRVLYFLLADLMHRFVYLNPGLALILVWVSVAMLLRDAYQIATGLSSSPRSSPPVGRGPRRPPTAADRDPARAARFATSAPSREGRRSASPGSRNPKRQGIIVPDSAGIAHGRKRTTAPCPPARRYGNSCCRDALAPKQTTQHALHGIRARRARRCPEWNPGRAGMASFERKADDRWTLGCKRSRNGTAGRGGRLSARAGAARGPARCGASW
jgi:Integral membrane protein TerC family